jgi:hypothetical protein
VLEVGTFRTLLGVGVGAGSELMLTSETITSIGDHRSTYSFHEHFVKPCDYSPHDRRAVNWTCDGCGKNIYLDEDITIETEKFGNEKYHYECLTPELKLVAIEQGEINE